MNSDKRTNRSQGRDQKHTGRGRPVPGKWGSGNPKKGPVRKVSEEQIRSLENDSENFRARSSKSSQVKRTFRSFSEEEQKARRARLDDGKKEFKPAYSSDKDFTRREKPFRSPRPIQSNQRGRPVQRRPLPLNEDVRLNRFIAQSGICSRREADAYIKAGLVTVNGTVITEMGVKVKPGDVVKYNGELVRSEKKVYVLLNKPKDFVTTNDDEQGRRTIIDLLGKEFRERVFPVGRLDRNTTGVILLTNDGDLAGKLTHPKYNKKKIYHVSLDKNLKRDDMNAIAEGIELEDGFFAPDMISYVDPVKKSEVGIEIHSGRNRIVRRLFEHFGYRVVKLDRVYFAGLTKKNLPRGRWRFLTEQEVNMLKMNAYE